MPSDNDISINIGAKDEASDVMNRLSAGAMAQIISTGMQVAETIGKYVSQAFEFAKEQIIECTNAAGVQEDAEFALAAAMKQTGVFSKYAFEQAAAYASQLQSVSRYGDEATLQSQALLVRLGNLSGDGLNRATQASADLAASLGIDLQNASLLVAKAAAGNTSSMSRYGIVLDETKVKAEGFTYVLEQMDKKFGGAAEAAGETFKGQIQKLTNAVGDLQESIGFAIIKSESFKIILEAIQSNVEKLTNYIKENQLIMRVFVNDVMSLLVDSFELAVKILEELNSRFLNTIIYLAPFSERARKAAEASMLFGVGLQEVDDRIDAMQARLAAINPYLDETSALLVAGHGDAKSFEEAMAAAAKILNDMTGASSDFKEQGVDAWNENAEAAKQMQKEYENAEIAFFNMIRLHEEVLAMQESKKRAWEAEKERREIQEKMDEDEIERQESRRQGFQEYLGEYVAGMEEIQEITFEANEQMALAWTTASEEITNIYGNMYLTMKTMFIDLQTMLIEGFARSVATSLVYGKSFRDLMKNLFKEMLAYLIEMLVKMAIAHMLSNAKKTASSMASLSAETYAGAYAATVQIPIVGPMLAPGVAAASLAAMLAGAAAAGATGAGVGAGIGAVSLAAEGGIITGGIAGRDSVPILGMPGEAILPLRLTNELRRVLGVAPPGARMQEGGIIGEGFSGEMNLNVRLGDIHLENYFTGLNITDEMTREIAEELATYVERRGGRLVASHVIKLGVPTKGESL